MRTFDRRAFLTALSSVAGAAVLAGCSESSGNGTDGGDNYAGDSATVDGLEMTLHAESIQQSVTVTPGRAADGDAGTPDGDTETPDGTPSTRTVESSEERQFVVVVLELSNPTDEPLGVPMPGGTAISEGEIYLHKRGSSDEPADANITQVPAEGDAPLTVGGSYTHDGTTYDRLTFALGDYQAELPAGESAAGWILYEIGADVTPDRLKLVADLDPQALGKRAEWELAEPSGSE